MAYLLIKWLHVFSAIVAVGANVTYGIWLARAGRNPEALPFTLRGIKLIDDRIANPAYGLLLVTGLAMAFVGGLSLTTPWLLTALVLYVLVALIGLLGYTPTLRRQIEALDREGHESSDYQALARRGGRIGMLLAVLVTVIIFLMVVKPGLWA
ncbi:MAG TPA: DUF2269 family protein [Nitrospiria bacterium]|nr:DUF2269 family protein [Nitrospiria bacterium]